MAYRLQLWLEGGGAMKPGWNLILKLNLILIFCAPMAWADFKPHPKWPRAGAPLFPLDFHAGNLKDLGAKKVLETAADGSKICVDIITKLAGSPLQFDVLHAQSEVRPYFAEKPEYRWDALLVRFQGKVGDHTLTFFGSLVSIDGENYFSNWNIQYFGLGNYDQTYLLANEARLAHMSIGNARGRRLRLQWRDHVRTAFADAERDFKVWRGVESLRLRYAGPDDIPDRSERIEITPKNFRAYQFLEEAFRSEYGWGGQKGMTYRSVPITVRWNDQFFDDPDFIEEQRDSDHRFANSFRRTTLPIRRSFPSSMSIDEQLAQDIEDSQPKESSEDDDI